MRSPVRIYVLGAIGIAAYILARSFPAAPAVPSAPERAASEIMAVAERRILACREERGLPPDPAFDINRTGLIGIESSPITTTMGDLAAKRTATNPAFAGLLVRLLDEAGVRRGDVIAVGASSSFPGSILAVLSAARAMDVEVLAIASLGASAWGANDPRFDWLDMSACAARDGGPGAKWLAATMGGDKDSGADLSAGGRGLIADRIRASGLPTFEDLDLARNVARRVRIYENAASGKPIRAFVNVGGAWANIGSDASVLLVKPGLTRIRNIPPSGSRGVLQEMASRGIPVIHLLNVKGLCSRYGLPLDPRPLPVAGEGKGEPGGRRAGGLVRIIAWAYLGLVVLVLAVPAGKRRAPSPTSRSCRRGPECPSAPDSGAGKP